jgi:type IV pilus biogenesis protein CpaD/CtpE
MDRASAPGVLCVLLCALLAGCADDPSDTARRADDSLRAWAATLRVAAEQWIDRRVPDVYFRQISEAARESLDEQAKTLSRKMPVSDARRTSLESRIAQLRQRSGELSRALDQSDRVAAETASRGLPGGAAS